MDHPGSVPRPPPRATAASEPPAPWSALLLARSSRLERLRAPLLPAGLVGALAVAISLRDPHLPGSWGGCPWLALTGHYCPGCGALRAVHDLIHLDVVGAASSNLLLVLVAPVLVLAWLGWTRRAWTGGARRAVRRGTTAALVISAAAATVAFTVLRNLPSGAWLAP